MPYAKQRPPKAPSPRHTAPQSPDDQMLLLHEAGIQRRITAAIGAAVEASLDEADRDDQSVVALMAPDPKDGESADRVVASAALGTGTAAHTRLPWDRGENFTPQIVRGRLASALLTDPTINGPLFHVVPARRARAARAAAGWYRRPEPS